MPEFNYTALDQRSKQITGTISANDLKEAAVRVRGLGYFPVKLAPITGRGAVAAAATTAVRTAASGQGAKARKKVPKVQVLLFTRELADLIDAGLPIDRGLSVIYEQTENQAMRDVVEAMRGDIRAGEALSEAMRKFPREFPGLYANMIHAGEVSGQLPSVMMRLADFLEKEQVRKAQILAALTYPMVLISVAVFAVIFLLTFVIPKLEAVFKDLGGDLPAPTQMLLAASNGISSYWYIILLAIGATAFLFRSWISTSMGRRTWDGMRIKAPLFGKLVEKIVMARFVRTLGTLMGGGVPILTAMEICAGAVGNAVTSDAVHEAQKRVKQGEPLAQAMENARGFAPLVIHMTAVGEETGRLPNMLIRTSDTLDFEVDNAMRRLTSLVEPLVVLLMGGFVGFVVLSILLPIFQANTLVK